MNTLKIFFLITLICVTSWSAKVNICLSVDNSLFSEEMYEGYTLAIQQLKMSNNKNIFDLVTITRFSTNDNSLYFLLNSDYTILSNRIFVNLIKKLKLKYVVTSFPDLLYINPFPSPDDEVKALSYQLRDSSRILFIYNSDSYAYNYLKALEALPGKIIFVKKYSPNNTNLDQMVNKNSIDTIITFLNPIQLRNVMKLVAERNNVFLSKVKVIAFSIYDYFDYISAYSSDYDGLYFFSILNRSNFNSFVNSYRNVFGHLPTQTSAMAYDSIFIMNGIINDKKIVDASSRITIESTKIERPLYFYKVQNGKPVLESIVKY